MPLSSGLSSTQARAIPVLLATRSIAEASRELRLAESTIHRWLKHDPAFQAAWKEARTALMDEAVGHAQRASTEAVATLRHILLHGELETNRIAAARTILEVGLKALERDELREQVGQIKRELDELRTHQPRFAAAVNGYQR